MKYFRVTALRMLLGTLGAAAFVTSSRATDWPQWGGNDPGRNMVSTETNLPENFSVTGTDPNVRWRATLGNYISGNPDRRRRANLRRHG